MLFLCGDLALHVNGINIRGLLLDIGPSGVMFALIFDGNESTYCINPSNKSRSVNPLLNLLAEGHVFNTILHFPLGPLSKSSLLVSFCFLGGVTSEGGPHELHDPCTHIQVPPLLLVGIVRGIVVLLEFRCRSGGEEILDVAVRGVGDDVAVDVGLPRSRVGVPSFVQISVRLRLGWWLFAVLP